LATTAAYTRSVLEPLVAALERSQTRVSELEREAGTLTAERDAAQAQHASILAVQLETGSSGAPAPFWRSWWPWLVLLVAIVLAGVLLGWPR